MAKRFILMILVFFLMLTSTFALDLLPKEYFEEAVAQAYPDWELFGCFRYGSGRWEGDLATYQEAYLMRVDDNMLRFKRLETLINPLREGDDIPWTEVDYVPVPLKAECAGRIAEMEPKEIYFPGRSNEITVDLLEGCADSLLRLDEEWKELYAMQNELVGVAYGEDGTSRLVIAHWNGDQYDRVLSSPPQTTGFFVNGIDSGDGYLTLMMNHGECWLVRDDNSEWTLSGWNSGAAIFCFGNGFLYDGAVGWYENNENFVYGDRAIHTALSELDFSQFSGKLVEMLDTSAFACTAQDDTPFYDAVNGTQRGTLYAHVVGRILSESDDWVQLHVGEADNGFDDWFRRQDLAFGDAVNEMTCGFPSIAYDYQAGRNYDDLVIKPLSQVVHLDRRDIYQVWLIGHDLEGHWLVLLNNAQLLTLNADAFPYLTETEHYLYSETWEDLWQPVWNDEDNWDEEDE